MFLVVALAGCASHGTSGPAWPQASKSSTDGGESLAPHESRQVVTAVEKSDDEVKPVVAPVAAPVVAPAADVAAPTIAPSASAPVEDSITSEEIIIEIDD